MPTITDIAKHLFVPRPVISDLKKHGIVSDGMTLDDARRACIMYWRGVAGGRRAAMGQDAGDHDLTAERARLAFHQANKTMLEEEIIRRRLLPADAVADEWCRQVSSMRAKLLSLPTKLASAAMAATTLQDVQKVATDEIYAALTELSNDTEYRADEVDAAESGDDNEAAAKTDRKPVGRPRKSAKPGVQRRTG